MISHTSDVNLYLHCQKTHIYWVSPRIFIPDKIYIKLEFIVQVRFLITKQHFFKDLII